MRTFKNKNHFMRCLKTATDILKILTVLNLWFKWLLFLRKPFFRNERGKKISPF